MLNQQPRNMPCLVNASHAPRLLQLRDSELGSRLDPMCQRLGRRADTQRSRRPGRNPGRSLSAGHGLNARDPFGVDGVNGVASHASAGIGKRLRLARAICTALVLLACLGAANAGLIERIAQIKPSVLPVGTFNALDNPRFGFRGTGFVVGDGNLLVTNAHVLPPPKDDGHPSSTVLIC